MSHKKVHPLPPAAPAPQGAAAGAAGSPSPARPTRAQLEALVLKIQTLVAKDPDKAARLLTDWLSRPADSSLAKKKKAG